MTFAKLNLDQNEQFGNALIEYDVNGKPINAFKSWRPQSAVNSNLPYADLQLEDE